MCLRLSRAHARCPVFLVLGPMSYVLRPGSHILRVKRTNGCGRRMMQLSGLTLNCFCSLPLGVRSFLAANYANANADADADAKRNVCCQAIEFAKPVANGRGDDDFVAIMICCCGSCLSICLTDRTISCH